MDESEGTFPLQEPFDKPCACRLQKPGFTFSSRVIDLLYRPKKFLIRNSGGQLDLPCSKL